MCLQYAGRLAEEGLIADALAYAAAAVSLANQAKVDRHVPVQPISVDLLASFAQDFHERLKAHSAAVGASGTRSGQSVVSRVSSFLDRSMMRMLGTESPSPSPAEMSKSASAASLTAAPPAQSRWSGGHAHRPSVVSDGQDMTTTLPASSVRQGTQVPQQTPLRSGLRPVLMPQQPALLNTTHTSHIVPERGVGRNHEERCIPAEQRDQGGAGIMTVHERTAMRHQRPVPAYHQHTQPPWMPPSLPAQGSSAMSSATQPNKGWFGGIADKLLPRAHLNIVVRSRSSGPCPYAAGTVPGCCLLLSGSVAFHMRYLCLECLRCA